MNHEAIYPQYPACSHCWHRGANTRSPLRLCRACYTRLGAHGRHDLAWLRSLRPQDFAMVSNSRRDLDSRRAWPQYRGPRSGFGVAHWAAPAPAQASGEQAEGER